MIKCEISELQKSQILFIKYRLSHFSFAKSTPPDAPVPFSHHARPMPGSVKKAALKGRYIFTSYSDSPHV